MPNGEQKSPFEKLLGDWQKKAESHFTKLEQLGVRGQELESELERVQQRAYTRLEDIPKGTSIWETLAYQLGGRLSSSGMVLNPETGKYEPITSLKFQGEAIARIKSELVGVSANMAREQFYANIYNAVPQNLLALRQITEAGATPKDPSVFFANVEDVLRAFTPPEGMTQAELDDLRETVEGMFQSIRAGRPLEAGEEMAPELLPELKVPAPGITGPVSLQVATVQSILQALQAPQMPEPILPESEWEELFDQLYPEYADLSAVEKVEAQAKEILAESKLYNEQMGEARKAVAEMPDYKLTDFLKELVVMPGVALLEVARKYYETTSQPMAAGFYKIFIPDIEALYQQHRATSDSDWQALQKAWEDWDAPFSGVPEFILKYILMENLVDPLIWLDIITLGASMVVTKGGKFARFAGIIVKAHRVVSTPFEAPFDAVKWLAGKLPKTITQRALVAANWSGKWAKVTLEKFAGKGKLVNKGMTMKDWTKIANRSIKYAFDNPQATDELAQFGRALLMHQPLDQDTLLRWSERLGAGLTKEQITREMVSDTNAIFEAIFQKFGSKSAKLMTVNEGAGRVLEIFGLRGGEPKLFNQATDLLSRRASNIVAEAGAFARLSNPGKALNQLVKRNFRYYTAQFTQVEWMKQATRIQSFVAGMEARVGAVWQKYVERTVIAPTAESYLTFGLYGPMNVIEDYWRSTLGGVFPRRMTTDRFAQLSKGISVDPDLLNPALGVSETLGRLTRRGGDDEWNNWILQLAMVGQKDWADKLYTGLVRLPGGFGMDLRRNFVGQKYINLFKEMGGEQFEAIVKAEARLPLLADKKLVRELRQAVVDAKTTLDLDSIKAVKDIYTRKSIYRKEVNNILKEHPDLPNSVRDYIIKAFDDNTLYVDGIKSANRVMRDANSRLVEEYLRGASLATKQFQALTDELVKLEVRNPEEMAHLLVNLNIASQVYGATPKQIMAQATIRSRGLPLAERRAHFDKIYDDILEFMEKSGNNLETLTNKLRLTMTKPESMVDWDKVVFGKGFEDTDTIYKVRKWIDELPVNVKSSIREVKVSELVPKEISAQYDVASKSILFKSSEHIQRRTLIHEVAHGLADDLIDVNDVNFFIRFLRSRKRFIEPGMSEDVVNQFIKELGTSGIAPGFTHPQGRKMHEAFARDFVDYIDNPARLEDVAGKGVRELFEEYFPKTQRKLPFTPEYMDRSQRLFDLLESKRLLADKFRAENMAWRRETFAGVGRKDLTSDWWDNFYLNLDSQYHDLNLQMMRVDGDITRTLQGIDMAAGIQPFSRPAIKVTNRVLAPQDVAQLVGARGDDLSRAIMDNLTIVNDRDGFIEYIMAMIRPGDEGFTREAVGEVYDQIVRSLRVNPQAVSWMTSKQLEMKAVREDLHHLYHGKLLPDNELTEIGRYVDETADMVEKLAFEKGQVGKKVVTKLRTDYQGLQDLRQQAMDEAQKWYYKEYTDYTNANVFDSIMRAIYPFWRYETVPETVAALTRYGWKHYDQLQVGNEVLVVDPDTLTTKWEPIKDIKVYDYDGEMMVIPAKGKDIEFTPEHRWLVITKRGYTSIKRGYQLDDGYDMIPRALPHEFPRESVLSPRDAAMLGWCCTDGYANRGKYLIIYQHLNKYLLEIEDLCGVKGKPRIPGAYTPADDYCNFTIRVRLEDSKRILGICPDWSYLPELVTKLSKPAAEAMWDAMFKAEGSIGTNYNDSENLSWNQKPGYVSDAFQILSVLLGKAITIGKDRVHILNNTKPYQAKEARRIRREHYKGKIWCPITPSGTWFANFNGCILPTGNSQRWFWLPRSFIRHPGTFTAFERWQDNSDYGYIPIPGTSIEVNPFRGTIYGTLTTRLTRRDYPEYYDAYEGASGLIEFNDFLTRYGFYPGAHIGIPLAMFGGMEPQMGEVIPAVWKSPLMVAQAIAPDNKFIKLLTDHIFGERFRNYMIMREVTARGGDASVINAKLNAGEALTDEEQALWDEARRPVALYSLLFEQAGLARLRHPEQRELYKVVSQYIEEKYGYTEDQQKWLRYHGHRIWDMIGGMSPEDQMFLQELDYWKWQTLASTLYPGKQQLVADKLTLDWDEIERYSMNQRTEIDRLANMFLRGEVKEGKVAFISSQDYTGKVSDLYNDRRAFIDQKQEENPLLRLEERRKYFEEEGIPVPVLHPLKELANLYFDIEIREVINPETMMLEDDWDTFWAERTAIENAVPDQWKADWEILLQGRYPENPLETIRREVNEQYISKYNQVWQKVLSNYPEDEQRLIREFLALKSTKRQLERQEEIQNMVRADGRKLISAFSSDVSEARRALRFANPYLDGWLYFWGRVSTFMTPAGEEAFKQISRSVGKRL